MIHTIFLGNGLNRVDEQEFSWSALLKDLSKMYGVPEHINKERSLETFFFEQVVLKKHREDIKRFKGKDSLDQVEDEIKGHIADKLSKLIPAKLYGEIVQLGCSNIITTNYDYGLQKAYEHPGFAQGSIENAETLYSLRRRRIVSDPSSVSIWHSHGEIDKPKTIMLGYSHYCEAVAQIDSYVNGQYTYQKDNTETKVPRISERLLQLMEESPAILSWIDLFFCSNIYILGSGLGFAEIDIWYALIARARKLQEYKSLGLESPKVFFYSGSKDKDKEQILESLSVEVVPIELAGNDWEKLYRTAIAKIREEMNTPR